MITRKDLAANPAFPLGNSDALWSAIAKGDHARLVSLLDLGLSPLGRIAGRFRNGAPESTSLWLLACEAPDGDLLTTIWDRLAPDERQVALTVRTGDRQTPMDLALMRNRAPVVEQLVRFNAELPVPQQQRWNGHELLIAHLTRITRELGPSPAPRDPEPDAAMVRTLRRNGLLTVPQASLDHPGKDGFESLCAAIRAGAVGCVDELLNDPIAWRSVRLNNDMPWSWLLLTCPAPAQVLGALLDHGVDVTLPDARRPAVWQEFCRSFVLKPFRIQDDWQQAAAHTPHDLLMVDPACRTLLEGRILRATLDQETPVAPPVVSAVRPRL